MNRNEIVRQYKRVNILIVFLLLLIDIPIVIPFIIISFITLFTLIFCVYIIEITIKIITLFKFKPLICENFGKLWVHLDNLSLFTETIMEKYEKKWGMTMKQIRDYISHRKQLGEKNIPYLLPYINRLCQLNSGAREKQETFLSALLSEEEIQSAFEGFSDSQMEEAILYWRKKELGEKKDLVNLLFKLTVEQDGIHNDEWNMLIQMLAQLRFNNRYIEYFKDRYFSLRTEFDDYKRKDTASVDYSVDNLKPYYAVLGLAEDASIEEIKQAYHELALQHHPDLPKNASRIEECEKLMVKINEAYEQLEKRNL